MSTSSPFRTENNHEYRWPPETVSEEADTLYQRVTHKIGEGEPKPFMRNYVAKRIVDWQVENAEDLRWFFNSYINQPEHMELTELESNEFPLDQQWWNDTLDKAQRQDERAQLKIEAWKAGELPHLKSRPATPYKVNSLLRLTPQQKLIKFLKALPDIHRDRAAVRGTDVHKLAEDVGQGQDVVIEDDVLFAHVENAVKFFDHYQPRFIEVESVVYSDIHGIAGQFDWLAEFEVAQLRKVVDNGLCDGLTEDVERWEQEGRKTVAIMGDYKTSEKGIKATIALQFASYSMPGNWIGRVDGTKDPMPVIDGYWGINVREDDYEVVPVVVDEDVRNALIHIHGVADWMTDTSKRVLKNQPARKS